MHRDAIRYRVDKSDQQKRARALAQTVSPALKRRILRMRRLGDENGEPLSRREIHRRLKDDDVRVALKSVVKIVNESGS